MAKTVRAIPATISKYTAAPINIVKKRRVAGYARVSTDHEDQQTSYAAQVDYYTNYINGRDDWQFAGLYTDEGISGTNTKRREGFKRMIADAKAGKIDLIITKSVSRFARNTVDSLTTVRELKDLGIEIYFEKENIWTLDSKGELLITIMSSLAQEESRSISENVTWGKRKRMADGKVSFAYSRFLGLDKDKETGKIVINHEEAKIVKLIFRLFLEGKTPHAIAVHLTEKGIKTPGGKDVWSQQTIRRMLSNEKYKGDALLQKEFTLDFLQKKLKKNEGEVPQYYVEGNHEAIIRPTLFDLVQEELARRKNGKTRYSGATIFSTKIKCADCGSWYGSKIWHSTRSYRKKIYECNNRYKEKCKTPYVTEKDVKEAFVAAYNQLLADKDEIIANAELVRTTLCATEDLQAEKLRLEDEISMIVSMTQNLVAENARVAQDQSDYQKRYDSLVKKYDEAKAQYDRVSESIVAKEAKNARLSEIVSLLKSQEKLISEFDIGLWTSTVDFVTVGRDKSITVTFRDGTEIKV